jgi:hypothetical protein
MSHSVLVGLIFEMRGWSAHFFPERFPSAAAEVRVGG